jgi:hypothetical protein
LQEQELCRPSWPGGLAPKRFSPDGRLLAVQYVRDLPVLPAAGQPLVSLLFHREGVIRLYEIPTGKSRGSAEGGAAWFTPDGKTLITENTEAIRLFDLPLAVPILGILVRALVTTGVFLFLGWGWRLWRKRRKTRKLRAALGS